jgi:septation ring formation regulator EzrA
MKKNNKETMTELRKIQRSYTHSQGKIEKCVELQNNFNSKLFKKTTDELKGYLDTKIEPIYERMEQMVESCSSSNSFNSNPGMINQDYNYNYFYF